MPMALFSQREYWLQMKLLLAQFDGLVKGYNDHCDHDKVEGWWPSDVCARLPCLHL